MAYYYAFQRFFTSWSTVALGTVTTCQLNVRTKGMQSKVDLEDYFDLSSVAQVNNSCFGIITDKALSG